MIERYVEWMVRYVSENPVANKCQEATLRMKEAFPELERTPGFVDTDYGRVEHWWCTGPDGEVYDPTALQFQVIYGYEPWKPGDEIRVGRCMNCGGEIYRRPEKLGGTPVSICGPECEQAFAAYLDAPKESHARERIIRRAESFLREYGGAEDDDVLL